MVMKQMQANEASSNGTIAGNISIGFFYSEYRYKILRIIIKKFDISKIFNVENTNLSNTTNPTDIHGDRHHYNMELWEL